MNGATTAIPLIRQISRSASQGVSFAVGLSRTKLNVELVLGQEAGPPSLSPIEEGFGGKVLQVMVICEDRKFNTMQVHVSFFQASHNS